ncbi:MAG: methyltransferase domain-containing protein [Streptosporangiaceae bacterium]|jgi:ubiquinone/menaquinone biosynthesis C-methylase UbiE
MTHRGSYSAASAAGQDRATAGQGQAGSGLGRLATSSSIRRQRRVWSGRAASWDQHGSAGLGRVTAAVLAAASPSLREQVVDLGCGTGQLSLPLAESGAEVLAVDVSSAMVEQLREEARRRGLSYLDAAAVPIERLRLPDRSVDLIVSSYALHHLRDSDKARLVATAFRWLRPGGRLVIADMMFGRGAARSDRKIIAAKVRVLAGKGPGGWWRIAKNAVRYLLRLQERPVTMAAWTAMLSRAGFDGVTGNSIAAEAGLVTGRRPLPSGPSPEPAAGRQPDRSELAGTSAGGAAAGR